MIKITIDTNTFMHDVSLDEIARLIKSGEYKLCLLTSVSKELNKKTLQGMEEGINGLKRLNWLKDLADFDQYVVEEVYADDQFVKWLKTINEHILFIASGDVDLKRRIYDLHNPFVQVFNLTRKGYILPFDPDYVSKEQSEQRVQHPKQPVQQPVQRTVSKPFPRAERHRYFGIGRSSSGRLRHVPDDDAPFIRKPFDPLCPICKSQLVIGICQYCGFIHPSMIDGNPTGSSYVDRSCDTSPAVTPYEGFWKLLAQDIYLKIKNGLHRIFDRYDESNAPPGEDPRVTRLREKRRKKFYKDMKKFKYKKGDKSSSY